ncbi:MAG: hypothetical protein LAP40_22640 [Acidobacteriia bacterium]|nr:hypothetical protein [Terriglobia bacterium]
MRLRFIDREGAEQVVDGRSAWLAAVRQGDLTPDTSVFDVHERRWVKASEIGGFPAQALGAR